MARKSRKNNVAENQKTIISSPVSPSWIYARISNESDTAEESIENQIALCREYINRDNELIFAGFYTDLGFSGTDFDRPGYTDMMAGILSGNIKCIVVKDLSRLGRTYIEVGELLFDTFVQYGVRFISVNDHYDSFSDDAGRKKLLILFKNLVNHMYSRDVGKKVKSAHNAKKQRKEPLGVAPYGYYKSEDKTKLVIDKEAAKIVKMIFDMRQNGKSIHNIVEYLNRQQVPSHQQRRFQLGEINDEKFAKRIMWSETFISRLLRNEVYTGSLVQGKYTCKGKKHIFLPKEQWIVHKNTHEAIISKEQFEAVQKLIQKSVIKYQHKSENQYKENRYAGMITCARCGKMAVRNQNRRKAATLYYYSCRFCCKELKYINNLSEAPKMPLKKLDALVMTTIQTYMDMFIQFDNLPELLSASAPLVQKRAKIAKDKVKLIKTINDSEQNLSLAYTHHLNGLLDKKEYQIVRAKIENDKQEANERLTLICKEQKKYDVQNILDSKWLKIFKAYRDCEIPSKEMLQALIERIYLTPIENKVDIIFNFEDCFKDLRQIMLEGGVIVDVKHIEISHV